MNRLFITLLLLLLTTLGGMGTYLAHMHREQMALQRANALFSAAVSQREQVIKQLQNELGRQAEAERELRQSLIRSSAIASQQQLNDQRIIRRNEVLQHWSDAALPDGIIRLQQHPSFATPGDYLEWMSRRQQLFDPGKSGADPG